MIHYSTGACGIGFIFRYHGSVFPKAACWALPNAGMAYLLHHFFHPTDDQDQHMMTGVNFLFAAWSGVLGFLVVFRNNQAYGRFWEGATIISQVRGNWFNAVSNLMAFCSRDPARSSQITNFHHFLVRLSSMLYCAALQQICDLRDDTMEIIDPRGISPESLEYLQSTNDRCEIILQWIQQLVVDAHHDGVLDIAPPILSRVFQELSNGIVSLNNVRKIRDIPFPFPYAQMITCMLTIQWCFTPIFAAYVVSTSVWAAVMCFLYTWSYACLIYIPNEIDQPFGADANDLPLAEMQKDYNKSLMNLLEPLAQKPPTYEYDDYQETTVVESGFGLRSIRKNKESISSRVSMVLQGQTQRRLSKTGSDLEFGSLRRSVSGWQVSGDVSPKRKKHSPYSSHKEANNVEEHQSEIDLTRDPGENNSEISVSNDFSRECSILSMEEPEQQERDDTKQNAVNGNDPTVQASGLSAEACRSPLQRATKASQAAKQEAISQLLLPQKQNSEDSIRMADGFKKAHDIADESGEEAQANSNLDGEWLPDLEKAAEDVVIYQHRGLSKAAKASHKASNEPPLTPHDLPMTRLATPLASPKTPPVTIR